MLALCNVVSPLFFNIILNILAGYQLDNFAKVSLYFRC